MSFAHNLLISFAASFFCIGSATFAEAAPCAHLRYTETEAKNLKVLKEMAEARLAERARAGVTRAVVFIVAGPDGKSKSQFLVQIPAQKNVVSLSPDLIAASHTGDKIYAFQSAASSEYIFPVNEAELKKSTFKPSAACRSASSEDRYIPGPAEGGEKAGSLSCQIVSFSGMKEASLVYDQPAKRCSEIGVLLENEERNQEEDLLLVKAVKELQSLLGSTAQVGPNRSPSIVLRSTQVLPRDAPLQEIGSNRDANDGAKSTRGTQIP